MTKDQHLETTGFPKLAALIKGVVDGFAAEWPKILGQGAAIELLYHDCVAFDKCKQEINDKGMLLEYEISGERSGRIYLKFPLRDAVAAAGSLLMEEEDDIKKNFEVEKLSKEYVDSFCEFGNQVAAPIEVVYRDTFPEEDENHIKYVTSHELPLDEGKVGELLSVAGDDEVLLTRVQCSIWSFDKGNIDILVNIDLAEGMFGEIVTASTKKVTGHILYVDSKADDIKFMKKSMRNTEFCVHICNNADRAISTLQREKIDLIMIDTEFSGANDSYEGLALCARIKRNMLLEDIPIVMTSANATKKLVLDCVRIGASDFIVKPFKAAGFLDKLAGKMRRKKLRK